MCCKLFGIAVPLLSLIYKRPFILWKKASNLCGFVAAAVYCSAKDIDESFSPANIFIENVEFGHLRFEDPTIKKAAMQTVIEYSQSRRSLDELDTLDLTDSGMRILITYLLHFCSDLHIL